MAVLLLAAMVTAAHRLGETAGMSARSSASTRSSPTPRRRSGSPASLVEERLAACANILGPCRSIYRWQGKVEEADEVAAIFKARADKAEALIARIAELHSYDVPAAVVWPIAAALARLCRWVKEAEGEMHPAGAAPSPARLERRRAGRDRPGLSAALFGTYIVFFYAGAIAAGTPAQWNANLPGLFDAARDRRDRRHRRRISRRAASSCCSARSS